MKYKIIQWAWLVLGCYFCVAGIGDSKDAAFGAFVAGILAAKYEQKALDKATNKD